MSRDSADQALMANLRVPSLVKRLYNTAVCNELLYDFRSDTVTRPTSRMLQAMVASSVGDDVFREDPSVNEFERFIAEYCGKESALFCSSGTLSNQLAVRAHLNRPPPYTVLLHKRSHLNLYENSGIAAHCGAGTVTIDKLDTASDVTDNIWPDDGDVHSSPTALVALENTLDGEILPYELLNSIANGLSGRVPVHLDGARLWNAAAATNVPIRRWTEAVDSVSLCFSKALGAPVGSVLAGNADFVSRARRFRKLYGGGWRQAGLLAAAAHEAFLEHFPHQLAADHARAHELGRLLVELPGNLFQTTKAVQTNMVWVRATNKLFNWEDCHRLLKERYKVLIPTCSNTAENRLVLHFQVNDEACELLISGIKEYLSKAGICH